MVKNTIILGLCFICLALPGRAVGQSGPGLRIELAYDVYLAGFLAGSIDLVVESDAEHYRIDSVSRSHGILDFLVDFRRRNSVLGRIVARKIMPARYSAEGVWAGEERSVRIEYGDAMGKSGMRFTARPNAVEDEREAVPRHLLRGAIDPFSALYQAILRQHERGKCDGKAEVFDGRRRYDFLFKAIGGEATAGPYYSGAAQVCRIRQIPIAGFSRRSWLPRLIRPEWTDIWLAKVREDLPVLPARLEANAGLGTMVVHLVAIGGRNYPPGEGPSAMKQSGVPPPKVGAFENDSRR